MDFSGKKINSLQHLISVLADRPDMSGDELKKYFDGNAEQIQKSFNELIDALNDFDKEVSDGFNEKADKGNTFTELAKKADKTDVANELLKKVDKVGGMGLSEENYTTEEKQKLESLYNYDDSAVKSDVSELNEELKTKADAEDVNTALFKKVDKEEGKGLSTNDYTNAEKERLENSVNYKGEVEENSLPTENNVKGDVYRIGTPTQIEKHYISTSFQIDEITGHYYGSVCVENTLYTREEYNDCIANDYFGEYIRCDVYDTNWNYICSDNMGFRNDCGGWCAGTELGEGMEEGITYYIVRSDDLEPMDTTLPVHTVNGEIKCSGYAIYNGESFDKFYNDETVDSKIAEVASTKADIEKWELIDTVTTTEDVKSLIFQQEPDGTAYNFKKMKVIVTLPSGGNGNAYFNIVKRGTNGGNGMSSVAYFLLNHRKVYGEFYIENGYGVVKTRSGVGEYSQFTNSSSHVPMNTFYDLRITANGTILAGTTFEIWGVRNK